MSVSYHQDLTITNDLAALSRGRDLVADAVLQGEFPADWTNRLQIAVDEAVTNIIEHGYEDSPLGEASINLAVHVDDDAFHITISDQGQHFDPNRMSDVDIKRHVEAGYHGGLGVFLMRRIMDVVDYRFENGKENTLSLVKYRP
jgi:serine/threonine-protein kinase RsbW